MSIKLQTFRNKAFLKECDCSKSISEEKIFSVEEIEIIKKEAREYIQKNLNKVFWTNGYVVLLSIETGMRVGELMTLKWSDIKSNYIHIHAQQLAQRQKKVEPNILTFPYYTFAEKN